MEKSLLEAIDVWMNDYKRYSVKQATYDRLLTARNTLSRHPIAEKPIDCLTTNDIQRYLNDLAHDGYAFATLKKQFNLLTAYIKNAISLGDVQRPIYIGVEVPVVGRPINGVKAYTEAEQRKLTEILRRFGTPADLADMLMLETGLRVGEAIALTWDDILWERRALRVSKTWVRLAESGRAFVQEGAKSQSSNRTVPLSRKALSLLEQVPRDCDYIFHNPRDSQPITYSSVRYHLERACAAADVPYKGVHALRHTFATNCYHKGCDVKLLSKMLGHADVSITYNTYIHLFGDALEEMRCVVD